MNSDRVYSIAFKICIANLVIMLLLGLIVIWCEGALRGDIVPKLAITNVLVFVLTVLGAGVTRLLIHK